ncbi:hypothetical protein [Cohnella sp. GCM10012308]|uniref:hypothetical protein n=1 Tax=Cohnella sp. GCM10012308 TaxID=3317329 RepID=UPI00361CC251
MLRQFRSENAGVPDCFPELNRIPIVRKIPLNTSFLPPGPSFVSMYGTEAIGRY